MIAAIGENLTTYDAKGLKESFMKDTNY